MAQILKQIATLYEQKLDTNVILLAELVISQNEQRPDFPPHIKFQMLVYYANALFNINQFARAENAYSQALQIRKFISKAKNSPVQVEMAPDMPSDVEIKYKMHRCYVKLRQLKLAVDILQNIPVKQRTPKINMALGNMYKEAGVERPAVACFKEVLKESPLAIEAAENLLKLGVEGNEVNSLMLQATRDLGWINVWIRGLAQMYAKDYMVAINTFKTIESYNDNATVLVNIGFCYNYMCDDANAICYLKKAFNKDPSLYTGRGLYANLLAQHSSSEKCAMRELERMVTGGPGSGTYGCYEQMETALWNTEHWLVMGFYMYAQKKYERAAYFGQQACLMSPRNVEALLLKALTFMQIGNTNDAILHFREILKYAPNRFDAYKGLVDCQIALNKIREALSSAGICCKQLNNSAPALTLYASVLLKDVVQAPKARSFLERALVAQPDYFHATYLLAEHMDSELCHEEMATLLRDHVKRCPTARGHQMLADCLARLAKEEDAFVHYNAALSIEPQNQAAIDGLNNLGRAPIKQENSYFLPVGRQDTPYSRNRVPSEHDIDSDSEWPSSTAYMAM